MSFVHIAVVVVTVLRSEVSSKLDILFLVIALVSVFGEDHFGAASAFSIRLVIRLVLVLILVLLIVVSLVVRTVLLISRVGIRAVVTALIVVVVGIMLLLLALFIWRIVLVWWLLIQITCLWVLIL